MEGKGDALFPKAVVRSCDEAIVCFNMSGQVAEVIGLLCQSVEDRTDHHTFRAGCLAHGTRGRS